MRTAGGDDDTGGGGGGESSAAAGLVASSGEGGGGGRRKDKDAPDQCPKHLQPLRNILSAYAMFDPDLGYCQGMNFIAGLLLREMDEFDAFRVLTGLMDGYGLGKMYAPGLQCATVCFFQLQRLLAMHLPELHMHL